MFVSREEALAVHQARQRLRTTKAGVGWVFCPYVAGAAYSIGHYVRDERGWQQCPGEGMCANHHLRPIPKVHTPALVAIKPLMASQCPGYDLGDTVFRAQLWSQKIIELTGGVIPQFSQGQPPDRLALVWRDPGRANGPLKFKWLSGILKGVPADLGPFEVKELLPAIIHGAVATGATITPLDNSDGNPIKHKTPYQTT